MSEIRRAVIAVVVGTLAWAQVPGMRPKSTGPWMDRSLSPDRRAELLLGQMTLDEKISLLHGAGWGALFGGGPLTRSLGGAGFVAGVERLGIPDLQMADAAMGVGRGAQYGRYVTALPSTVAEAATWDLKVASEYGALIGRELRDLGFNMSLGGGVNLTREPRNGRNFEYKGEDPILAGRMLGAEMKALQQQGVIGDIKHYAVNDQENGRNFVNVKVGNRAMRESDLLAFEIGVKESGVGAVMCSYNLLNGDYACENDYLLNQVLKKDWGFQGFVISDWGATHSVTKAAIAGLDMEQPGSEYFGAALKKAVESGEVPRSRVDDMVRRILRTEFAVGLFDNSYPRQAPDIFAGFDVAQRVAEQGSVLLKNANSQLPLSAARLKSIAVIGSHADLGVLSGGGSAQVDPAGGNPVPPKPGQQGLAAIFGGPIWHRSSPLKAIRAKAPNARVEYDSGDDVAKASALARSCDVAIVIVNQPSTEGVDIATLALPGNQNELIAAVAAANPKTIVVIESGGAVSMPWVDRVAAIVEAWFPGIRGGEAIASVLFGDVNPSGKLPLTFPRSEADVPRPELAQQPAPRGAEDMQPFFPGAPFKQNARQFDLDYSEGLKVGYRWYDSENKKPLFPFGFGLSYTTFSYSAMNVGADRTVAFTVKNTGTRAGAEIAQVYATLPAAAGEPFKRLVAWEKITLNPGESKTVALKLDPKYLSIYDENKEAWQLVPGQYLIHAGSSSRDLPLNGKLNINDIQAAARD